MKVHPTILDYIFYLLYGDQDFNVKDFANLIKDELKPIYLSGKKEVVKKFEELKCIETT